MNNQKMLNAEILDEVVGGTVSEKVSAGTTFVKNHLGWVVGSLATVVLVAVYATNSMAGRGGKSNYVFNPFAMPQNEEGWALPFNKVWWRRV